MRMGSLDQPNSPQPGDTLEWHLAAGIAYYSICVIACKSEYVDSPSPSLHHLARLLFTPAYLCPQIVLDNHYSAANADTDFSSWWHMYIHMRNYEMQYFPKLWVQIFPENFTVDSYICLSAVIAACRVPPPLF